MNFAMATVELMLANVVHRFDWGLPPGKESRDIDVSARVRASSPPERETSLSSKITCVLVAFFLKTYWDTKYVAYMDALQ